jgi:hypothetical protein
MWGTKKCVKSRGDKTEKHKMTEKVNSLHWTNGY